jgi:hypothetical protein
MHNSQIPQDQKKIIGELDTTMPHRLMDSTIQA